MNLSKILFPAGILLSFLLFCSGCKSQEEVVVNESLTLDADAIKNIDMEKDVFTEYIDSQIDTISVEVVASTKNRTTQRAAIEMRKFFNKKLHKYENVIDSRKTFLNTWSLVYRFEDYITKGDGKSLFGTQQEEVKKTISAIMFHLEKLAGKHLTDKQLKRVKNDLSAYAAEYPIKGYFQDTPEITTNGFVDFLRIPLAPFRAVGAINKGGQSMEDIANTVARFTDITEDLPDEIRWQLQVLAVQLQQNDILKTNTDSFQSLAKTSEQLVKIVDQYPEKVSEKVKKAAKDLEATVQQLSTISKQIDASMAKLQNSSENFDNFGKNINQSTEKITASLKQVEQSSEALTKAASAVSLAMKDIMAFTKYIEESSDPEEEKKDEDSFLVQVEKASAALEKSAAEISGTLQKVIDLSDKKPFSDEINSIDKKAQSAVILTRQEGQSLIDYIFKKAIILISVIFILSLIVVITKSRVSKAA